MARVLVTRALPEAEETASQLGALGHEVLIAPLRSVEGVATPFPVQRPDAVIATSRNAIGHGVPIPAEWRALPILCVGEKTAEAARAAGFFRAEAAEGDAVALQAVITKAYPSGSRLAYLAGEPRRPELEVAIRAGGFALDTLLRYRMRDLEGFPEPARAALIEGRLDATLHFSAESARAFFKRAQSVDLMIAACKLRHACLSPAVAAAAREAAGQSLDVIVAQERSSHNLVATLHASFT
jgi:uroporphyrinogen-III synthase